MFDIGFLELVVIAIVALVVIGPEQLPGAIRTGSAYLRRIRRSVSDIRQEIEQELHNDAVMQELKNTRDEVKQAAESVKAGVADTEADIRAQLKELEGPPISASKASRKPDSD